MAGIRFSGIAAIPPQDIFISPTTLNKAEALAAELNLTALPESKRHTTVLHQNTSGLKQLCKLYKKYEKGKLEDSPVVYPQAELPQIDTEGAEVLVVDDQNPKTGEERTTVRIVLRQELQTALSEWVSQLCELNGLQRDAQELERIYHVSYANRTGLPGDSVR